MHFSELLKRHTEFTELSASLLNEFIEKVIVHEAVKTEGKRTMQVDIYRNFIGKFELPQTEEQEEMPKRTSRKKLRRNMTEERRNRERQRDHQRYAKKAAAKAQFTRYNHRNARWIKLHNRIWKRRKRLAHKKGKSFFRVPYGYVPIRSHPFHSQKSKGDLPNGTDKN